MLTPKLPPTTHGAHIIARCRHAIASPSHLLSGSGHFKASRAAKQEGLTQVYPHHLPHSHAARVICSPGAGFVYTHMVSSQESFFKVTDQKDAEHENSRKKKGLTQVYPLHGLDLTRRFRRCHTSAHPGWLCPRRFRRCPTYHPHKRISTTAISPLQKRRVGRTALVKRRKRDEDEKLKWNKMKH